MPRRRISIARMTRLVSDWAPAKETRPSKARSARTVETLVGNLIAGGSGPNSRAAESCRGPELGTRMPPPRDPPAGPGLPSPSCVSRARDVQFTCAIGYGSDSWGLGLRASPLLPTTQPVAGAVGTTPTPCIVRHRSRTTMWSVCTACPHPRSTSRRSRKCVQPAP